MDPIRATLTTKLAEIEDQLTAMKVPPKEQSNISFGKRVGDGTQMAVARMSQVAVADQLQVTEVDVRRALAKLDEGSYGRCDACGRPIPEGRLEALPWATLCVEDAGKR